jgi:hypothetical protein
MTDKTIEVKVQWKTNVNLVWGKPIEYNGKKREAIAYVKGFPATFYLTDRRAFVVGAFVEKKNIFSKSANHYVYYEVALHYLRKYELDIHKNARVGYISFNAHGDIQDGIIHFIRLDPKMIKPIKEVLENVRNIKKPREDSGIVVLGENPQRIFEKRIKE